MCDIGKPLEILDVEPLNLPAHPRKEEKQQEAVAVPAVEFPVAEIAPVEKS